MISTFVLLTVVGGVCRLGLNWVLRRKLGVSLGLPPILALAFVILTGLPDILSPVSINLPLGLVLGLLLPDLCYGGPGDERDTQGSTAWLHCPHSRV
jgi:hypothetical protein